MALWTIADVRVVAPEFDSVGDAVVQRYVDWAAAEVNTDIHGSRAVRAGALLTAHLLTTLPSDGAGSTGPAVAGRVQRERVGDVETEYAVPYVGTLLGAESGLDLSRYGLEYARLVRLASRGPWLV